MSFRSRILVLGVMMAAFGSLSSSAKEIPFVEKFALAADRQEILKQLIPGTEEYFYFHCLHYQNQQEYDQVDLLLTQWVKQSGYTSLVKQIQRRQALLTYDRNPEKSLAFLIQELGVRFDHQQQRIQRERRLASSLDANLISRERLAESAFRRYENLQGFQDSAFHWLAVRELTPVQRRDFLSRLSTPDLENLVDLIVGDLNFKDSGGFGSLSIHRQLTLLQLDTLVRRLPTLQNQQAFVDTYVSKLIPSDDVDWRSDMAAYEAYLNRLWQFVGKLDAVHNSLKAQVLYHRLDLKRSLGDYDLSLFTEYLKLPRNVGYLNPRFAASNEARRFSANLGQDFSAINGLPPVFNDEPLVRDFLSHAFLEANDTKAFDAYVDNDYLKRLLAETKIVNGLGDMNRWAAMLPPETFQALKDRVDLEFASTNAKFFAAEDPVFLDVNVKNVSTLIVKVFEINSRNFYRENGKEIDTTVNLDGLVANSEVTYEYKEPPVRRVSRHFEFPELSEPGVYVIDFIGNGISSRVVVRKGQLNYLSENTPFGYQFTVLNEQNQPQANASIWMSGQEYTTDSNGQALIPFSTRPSRQPLVLSKGNVASLRNFDHGAEDYRLEAGFFIDRESLLEYEVASLVIRPQLYLNDKPVSPQAISNLTLTLTSVDHDGVESTQTVEDFKLFSDRESTHEFAVPRRLSQLQVQLLGTIKRLSDNQEITIQQNAAFALNGIEKTDKTADVHLVRTRTGYQLNVLGKTGEPLTNHTVRIELAHRDFRHPVTVNLQSDEAGQIQLGELLDISTVQAKLENDVQHTWPLDQDQRILPTAIHAAADEEISIPFMGSKLDPADVALFEVRGDRLVADLFKKMRFENGMINIQDLDAGDYQYIDRQASQTVRIRITEGTDVASYLVSDTRHLERRSNQLLHIRQIKEVGDEVVIQLDHADAHSRVHITATRYLPQFNMLHLLGQIRDAAAGAIKYPDPLSLYVEGRDIGEEYRYILDRRYAKKYPGNMLQRPELLLNPWDIRSTQTDRQDPSAGQDFGLAADNAAPAASAMQDRLARQAQLEDTFASLDFLADPSVQLINLTADEKGEIRISKKLLEGRQHLHVLAVDPVTTEFRSFALDRNELNFRDLRLASALDADKHFTQKKTIKLLGRNESLTLTSLGTTKVQTFDSLNDVYQLLLTLNRHEHLVKFNFLLNWESLTSAEKQAKYSEFASHELNFFLYKKDRPFFNDVVRPHLQFKFHKTFLDHWLLENDLSEFRQPWNYAQLNIVERILLARRIDDEYQYTRRHVNDLVSLVPPNRTQWNYWFETALGRSALDADEKLNFGFAGEARGGRVLSERFGGGGFGGVTRSAVPSPTSESLAEMSDAESDGAAVDKRAYSRGRRANRQEEQAALGLQRKGMTADDHVDFFAYDATLGDAARDRQLYRTLESTKEWVENNYYRLPIESQNAELVTANAFWNDFANSRADEPFFSTNWPAASGNFTEMMFALAVLDLPLKSNAAEVKADENQIVVSAKSPTFVFQEQILEAQAAEDAQAMLVSQNYFKQGDRYQQVDGQQVDKFVSGEFLTQTVYGCHIVVTNPTSAKRETDVLIQIPEGAIPVSGGQMTKSLPLTLDAYRTTTVEYFFYFPAVGQFAHYPVQIAEGEQTVVAAAATTLTVVDDPTTVDKESWNYISQFGSEQDVLQYLQNHNLNETDLERIAFRMQDKGFFQQVVDLLSKHHQFHATLWSYALTHDVATAAREYLKHRDDFANSIGAYLDSPLLSLDPVVRKTYQHMEYKPLVNARTHQLGRNRAILNDRFFEQYVRLMTVLSQRRTLDNDDLMSVTYYLLLQDRIEEAMTFFAKVRPDQLEVRMQYDYCAAYLDCFAADPDVARTLAAKYANYPVDRWRNAFAGVQRLLDEIDGKVQNLVDKDDRNQAQEAMAAQEPTFELEVQDSQLIVRHRNLKELELNCYLMDLELLFSRNPFVQQYAKQFSHIKANYSQTIQLSDSGETKFDLPDELKNANVLVELAGAGKTKSVAHYSNSLDVQISENYGQLQVNEQIRQRPLSTAYVKVYAQMNDGSVRFYKDGYTDLRGRFDYTSLSTNELDNVQKFSILVMSETNGAVVKEAQPPKR
ncbi:MAG: hypothetical protein KDA87_12540 [Planctomycetales bacterium]|nr:hypothetical protein [Planctomycetales bacterium]